MERGQRVPPGQRRTDRFPVLHHGRVPRIDPRRWTLRIWGLVEKEVTLDLDRLVTLPRSRMVSDIHCVTGWSRLDNEWEGVQAREVMALARPLTGAGFVMVHAAGGFSTNLSMGDFLQEDVIFATHHDGRPLTPDHGGPVRLVVPRLYFWKSAKWVTGVEVVDSEGPGFWEQRGYHIHGDPWIEERYSDQMDGATCPPPPPRCIQ